MGVVCSAGGCETMQCFFPVLMAMLKVETTGRPCYAKMHHDQRDIEEGGPSLGLRCGFSIYMSTCYDRRVFLQTDVWMFISCH